MKTTHTQTAQASPNSIELETLHILRVLFRELLSCIVAILLYEYFKLWTIAIVLIPLVAILIHRNYREMLEYDWSIEIDEFTMEEAMADLEHNSY